MEYGFTLRARESGEEWAVSVSRDVDIPDSPEPTHSEAYLLARSEAQERANACGESVEIIEDGGGRTADYVEPNA